MLIVQYVAISYWSYLKKSIIQAAIIFVFPDNKFRVFKRIRKLYNYEDILNITADVS